jgi:hypothetical protein
VKREHNVEQVPRPRTSTLHGRHPTSSSAIARPHSYIAIISSKQSSTVLQHTASLSQKTTRSVLSLAALFATMSFGYSVGDVVFLTRLAWKTEQEAEKACGQHDELTMDAAALYEVLKVVETKLANPRGGFKTADYDYHDIKQELIGLLNGVKKTLGVLHSVLAKYNALSEDERKLTKLWSKVRFANGEMLDMADVRLKLSTYAVAISMSSSLIALGSQGRVESYLNSPAELENMRKSLNWITAQINAQASEGSALTTYESDDGQIWKDFRRELVGKWWPTSVLNGHKELNLEYVNELGQRGVLDGREDDAQQNPDLGETNHGKAVERAIWELDEALAVLRERNFEPQMRNAERDPSNDKKRSGAGKENPEVFFMETEAPGSPHPSPPSAPTQTLSDEIILTRKEDKLNQSIQERYEQKVERYLATYDDSDLASIASYAPSMLSEDSSISSFSSNPSRGSTDKQPSALLEGVEHILAEPFLSNTTFGPAYVVAIENIGMTRFSRNLTRLLDRYSSDLRKEAQGWLEVNTARVVRPVYIVLLLMYK